MISKYIVRKSEDKPQAQHHTPPRVIKKRAPRTRGGFKYRGIPFMYVIKDNKISLFTWNEALNCLNIGITVNKEHKKKAIMALAKIGLAEQELDALGAIGASSDETMKLSM